MLLTVLVVCCLFFELHTPEECFFLFQLGDIPGLHEFLHCIHSQVPNVNILAYAQNSVLTELVNVPGSSALVLDPPSAEITH